MNITININTMVIDLTTSEANVIQVAIDHLYDMHKDVLADAKRIGDVRQIRESMHILIMIDEIHGEIQSGLKSNK